LDPLGRCGEARTRQRPQASRGLTVSPRIPIVIENDQAGSAGAVAAHLPVLP
jgi:hypothetical protein